MYPKVLKYSNSVTEYVLKAVHLTLGIYRVYTKGQMVTMV